MRLAAVVGVVLLVGGLVLSANSGSGTSDLRASAAEPSQQESNGLVFQVDDEYRRRDGVAGKGYPSLEGKLLVEPHRATTLLVQSPRDGHFYRWMSATAALNAVGEDVQHHFPVVGTHAIDLVEVDAATGVQVRSVQREVVCTYVRREVRSLTADDREKFLKTMQIVYSTPEAEGRSLYGTQYHDISYFAERHNSLASDKECDHLHDGMGFFTSHVALSMEFEQVLQAVTPEVSLAYWDFTKDAETVRLAGGDFSKFYASPIFDEMWFGAVPSRQENAERNGPLDLGRFGVVSADPAVWNRTATISNAYGHLRAPWNTVNGPNLVRSQTTFGFAVNIVPDCAAHSKLLQFTSFSKFAMESQYVSHGPVHSLIGGTTGGDNWMTYLDAIDFDVDAAQEWAIRSFAVHKDMWRADVMSCPASCSADAPPAACKCTCDNLDSILSEGASQDFLASYVHPHFALDANVQNSKGQDVSADLLKMFCNADDDLWPQLGDSLSSSSSLDPTFWVMHGTIDRLFHWRSLQGFQSMDWDDKSYIHTDDGACFGHQQGDALGWKNLFDQDDHEYTNRELVRLIDPSGKDSSLPYVYADFEWPHCSAQGFSLNLM